MAAAQTATAGIDCSEVAGHVEFGALTLVPSAPAVGDDVEILFDVSAAVYSVTRMVLIGGDALLQGDREIFGSRQASFRLTAVQAGTALLQLIVAYGTEERCIDSYGNQYFRLGPDRSVMSGPYAVEIAAAGAPCPGDCDGDHTVRIDELVRGVRIALGEQPTEACAAFDRDRDGAVAIDELIAAVTAALGICRQEAQSAPTPTNPPGRCCCGGLSFSECQARAQAGTCFGWGDPCPTPFPSDAAQRVGGQR